MSSPTRQHAKAAKPDADLEDQEEQTYEERCIGIQNREETQAPSGAPLVAPLGISRNSQTTISPHRIVFGVVEGLPGSFPRDYDLLQPPGPRSSSLSELPSPAQMTNTGLRPLYEQNLAASARAVPDSRMNSTLLPCTIEDFLSSLPQRQQRPDAKQNSSLRMEVAEETSPRPDSLQFPSPGTSLRSNDDFVVQLVAAQTDTLVLHQRQSPAADPATRLPSSLTLVGGRNVFSLLPSHPPSKTPTNSPRALSNVARFADRALPFSPEQESRIALIGGPESFPMVLHRALAELERVAGGRAIATFLPDGRSFFIHNQVLFTRQVLPVFFPMMESFASFQRQLYLYDFARVSGTGVDRGAYHHKLFVRDHPAMSSGMKPTKIKGTLP